MIAHPPAGVSCFKCGGSGHWSRDCTLPPSEWLRKPAAPAEPANRHAAESSAAAAAPRTAAYGRSSTGGNSTQGVTESTPQAVRGPQRTNGCYKCGKSGHWAKDCTAPPDQQLPRGSFPGSNDQNHPVSPNMGTAPASQAKKPPAKRARKRKIRVEDLKEKDAIAEVFYHFPDRFARRFKGEGHEVGDLRRLLGMYRLWQQKHFPQHGFDEAMDQIADLGRSNRLKVELREMRQNVLKVLEHDVAPLDGGAQAERAAPPPAAAGRDTADGDGAHGGPADAWDACDDNADDDSGDELVALQQQSWDEAAPQDMLLEPQEAHAGAQAARLDPDGGAQQGHASGTGLSVEDEELLLALAEAPLTQAAGLAELVQQTATNHSADGSGAAGALSTQDEEVSAPADASLPQADQPGSGSAGREVTAGHVGGRPVQSEPSAEDDELPALADAHLSAIRPSQQPDAPIFQAISSGGVQRQAVHARDDDLQVPCGAQVSPRQHAEALGILNAQGHQQQQQAGRASEDPGTGTVGGGGGDDAGDGDAELLALL